MTAKEAIKMLRTIKRTVFLGNQKFKDALDVAIEALEAQNAVVQMDLPKISEDDLKKMLAKMNHQQQLEWIVDGTIPNNFGKDTNVPSYDTISRKMAIDALDKRFDSIPMEQTTEILMLRKDLRELPSAQPETELLPDTKAVPDDRDMVCLSERVSATYYDDEHEEWTQKSVTIAEVLDSVCDEYTVVPSAQPEREKGEWIDYTEYGYVECPFCKSATNCDGNKDELHFCFSCGADMREEEHTMEEFMYGQDMGSPEDGSL